MATGKSTIDYILDQLSSLGEVRARKMFGEYALYFEEKVVALVCDNELFVKITNGGKALVGKRYKEGFAYPGAKPSLVIGAEELDNSQRLCELIRTTAAELAPPRPKPKQKASVRLPAKPPSPKSGPQSNPHAQSSASKKTSKKKASKRQRRVDTP